ncbi:hypothetical protein [Gimesia sp.]|uniref:hypothetical protein n=1 Tax=Gimesia sp. TaxID=2024833 RepID=UPI003A938ACD
MSVSASELLSTYVIRLKMQKEGITNPSDHVKEVTSQLVNRLSELDGSEKITIENEADVTRFVVAKTGEVLAELENSRKEN